ASSAAVLARAARRRYAVVEVITVVLVFVGTSSSRTSPASSAGRFARARPGRGEPRGDLRRALGMPGDDHAPHALPPGDARRAEERVHLLEVRCDRADRPVRLDEARLRPDETSEPGAPVLDA